MLSTRYGDGDGFRVKKVEGGVTTYYINKYYQKTGVNGIVRYYYLGDKLVAYHDANEGLMLFIHQDHLTGSSLTTESLYATVTGSIKYKPYGETRSLSGSLPAQKFTGQRLDDVGLYHYGARYYDPALGRFISADPIWPRPSNPQGFNRYSYVINNPLKYVDPSGKDWIIVGGSGSVGNEWKFWYDLLSRSGLLKPGEVVIFLPDNDPEQHWYQRRDVSPREAQLLAVLNNPELGLTDIKIIGHSEGAATVGTFLARLAVDPGLLPASVTSELKAFFLLELLTGPAAAFAKNYDYSGLSRLPGRLREKGLGFVVADIYNVASVVHMLNLPGWEDNTRDVSGLYGALQVLAVVSPNGYVALRLALQILNSNAHEDVKAKAMATIKAILDGAPGGSK